MRSSSGDHCEGEKPPPPWGAPHSIWWRPHGKPWTDQFSPPQQLQGSSPTITFPSYFPAPCDSKSMEWKKLTFSAKEMRWEQSLDCTCDWEQNHNFKKHPFLNHLVEAAFMCVCAKWILFWRVLTFSQVSLMQAKYFLLPYWSPIPTRHTQTHTWCPRTSVDTMRWRYGGSSPPLEPHVHTERLLMDALGLV